jgi:hypothetical protein
MTLQGLISRLIAALAIAAATAVAMGVLPAAARAQYGRPELGLGSSSGPSDHLGRSKAPRPDATTRYFYPVGVSCKPATACTAVGRYLTAPFTPLGLAERWNGTRWSIQTPPNPAGTSQSELDGVSCISATACTVVGSYTTSSTLSRALAERWERDAVVDTETPEPRRDLAEWTGRRVVHLRERVHRRRLLYSSQRQQRDAGRAVERYTVVDTDDPQRGSEQLPDRRVLHLREQLHRRRLRGKRKLHRVDAGRAVERDQVVDTDDRR